MNEELEGLEQRDRGVFRNGTGLVSREHRGFQCKSLMGNHWSVGQDCIAP